MSDPVSNVEIEDVLSSIRRLVSEDARMRPAKRPDAQPTDKLVLTPSFRVADEHAPRKSPDPDEAPAEPVLLTQPLAGAADKTNAQDSEAQQPEPEPQESDPEPMALSLGPAANVADAPAEDASGDGADGALHPDPDTLVFASRPDPEREAHPHAVSGPEESSAAPTTGSLLSQLVEQEVARVLAEDADDIEAESEPQTDAPDEAADDDFDAAVAEWFETKVAEPSDDGKAEAEERQKPEDPVAADNAARTVTAGETAAEASGPPQDSEDDPTAEAEATKDADSASALDAIAAAIETETRDDEAEHPAPGSAGTDPLEDKIAALEKLVGSQSETHEPSPEPVLEETTSHAALFRRHGRVLDWRDQAAPEDPHDTPVSGQPSLFRQDLPALDEDMLRDMVSDIVRQELQGALGERITRNVRKLVRREIHRVLMSQDFD